MTNPTTVGQPEAVVLASAMGHTRELWQIDLADLRRNTFNTIAALGGQGLPAPSRVDTQRTEFTGPNAGKVGLSLTLTFAHSEDVDAWAKHLALPPAEAALFRGDGNPFVCYETRCGNWDRPIWIGWHTVQLQAFLPPSAGVAAAVLQPDHASLPEGP